MNIYKVTRNYTTGYATSDDEIGSFVCYALNEQEAKCMHPSEIALSIGTEIIMHQWGFWQMYNSNDGEYKPLLSWMKDEWVQPDQVKDLDVMKVGVSGSVINIPNRIILAS